MSAKTKQTTFRITPGIALPALALLGFVSLLTPKVRLNLPTSPSTHQLFKGRDTELMVLDSSPGRPPLRTVYLEPIGNHRR